ncbi:LamB/YcsF family protein [Cryobacterium sp. Hh7]|uniref:LamB/YcsF family protein n=1 Tax=Cryobacterium sp. Hh7 TaxID=1259159 RepID=UPI001069124A|nr:5-oxoprolinase subunit PxpA [Cryobacterium sp. Hh7]TFD49881.1 LamB/YcsF family protein [Cryobacterium sp. Hh7]
MSTIDLNSDVGESFGNWTFGDDALVIASVTSVNVACGFHAGDPSTIRATCEAAAAAGVTVGAHPGYRDLVGFGRRFLDIAPRDLTNDVIYQLGAMQALARISGTSVSYVKPHGALYNTIAHHDVQARSVVDAILAVDPALPILVLPNSTIEAVARAAGLRTVAEAFADRAYLPDGTLVPRTLPGSVLHSVAAVTDQAILLAESGQVRCLDGTIITLPVESICLHGDTPGAAHMAATIRSALDSAGISVRSFV